jgi:hypothetical protein
MLVPDGPHPAAEITVRRDSDTDHRDVQQEGCIHATWIHLQHTHHASCPYQSAEICVRVASGEQRVPYCEGTDTTCPSTRGHYCEGRVVIAAGLVALIAFILVIKYWRVVLIWLTWPFWLPIVLVILAGKTLVDWWRDRGEVS